MDEARADIHPRAKHKALPAIMPAKYSNLQLHTHGYDEWPRSWIKSHGQCIDFASLRCSVQRLFIECRLTQEFRAVAIVVLVWGGGRVDFLRVEEQTSLRLLQRQRTVTSVRICFWSQTRTLSVCKCVRDRPFDRPNVLEKRTMVRGAFHHFKSIREI